MLCVLWGTGPGNVRVLSWLAKPDPQEPTQRRAEH